MMGQQSGAQDRLFYFFNLNDHVPSDHLLRGIDRFLDLSDLRKHRAPFYSHIGRPSIDAELMIRMLIVGYCFGIRSERWLCEEVHLNLSSFSKNRHVGFGKAISVRLAALTGPTTALLRARGSFAVLSTRMIHPVAREKKTRRSGAVS